MFNIRTLAAVCTLTALVTGCMNNKKKSCCPGHNHEAPATVDATPVAEHVTERVSGAMQDASWQEDK